MYIQIDNALFFFIETKSMDYEVEIRGSVTTLFPEFAPTQFVTIHNFLYDDYCNTHGYNT